MPSVMNDDLLLRYGRQILLPEIDLEGQQKICDASVLIIGLGGLGSAVAYYLAAAGVGRLLLNDFDTVDWSNLQRQIVHNETRIGLNKAESARQTLHSLNSNIQLEILPQKLDRDELLSQAKTCDVIVDASDNFNSRYLINEVSLLSAKPLVSGAALQMQGQVSVFNATADSGCYQCLYGENQGESRVNCAENGVLAPLVGIIGSIQATETLKLLSGFGETLDNLLLTIDARNMQTRRIAFKQDPCCPCHALNPVG